MSSQQFYRERAAEARAQADDAVLENVRDLRLRSAEIWQTLADRAERVDRERHIREEATRLKSEEFGRGRA